MKYERQTNFFENGRPKKKMTNKTIKNKLAHLKNQP